MGKKRLTLDHITALTIASLQAGHVKQEEIHAASTRGRLRVVLINAEKHAYLLTSQASNTRPDGWTGHEAYRDQLIVQVITDGLVPRLPGIAHNDAWEKWEECRATRVVAAQRPGGNDDTEHLRYSGGAARRYRRPGAGAH